MTVVDRDHGYKKRLAEIKDLAKKVVTVGIHEEQGAEAHADGTTVLDVAVWNEFGTSRVPARPFVTPPIDGAGEQLKRLAKLGERGLEQFGAWAAGQMQARISAGVPPPNAPSTVARKGSSTPLVDTGLMRSKITHQVKDKE